MGISEMGHTTHPMAIGTTDSVRENKTSRPIPDTSHHVMYARVAVSHASLAQLDPNMPPATRSKKQSKKSAVFYILIDKTPRNIDRPVKTTAKDKRNPKQKTDSQVVPAAPPEPKSKAKSKRFTTTKPSSAKAEDRGKDTVQSPDVGEPEDPLPRAPSIARPSGVFVTPPRSHPPPRPPKLPDHRSYDPETTMPPQFHNDGTPSPEPGRRRSHHNASARSSSLLPPSSPIHSPSSPDVSGSNTIFLSAHAPGSPSQFHTPTRKTRKRKRTPLSKPHLRSEGEVNNDDLFAYGLVDDLDERGDSVDWEDAESDKENHGGLPEFSGSANSDNKPAPSMPLTDERGILQPRAVSLSPARSRDSDPFGFFATERLLKARRAETRGQSETGPSDRRRGPRQPLGELAAAEVAPTTQSVQVIASPTPVSAHPQYSDSEIEDLYAPASPPHTPRQRVPHTHATSPPHDTTPVAATAPLTPRNCDSARAFTMRRRRQKELHAVGEHGSEVEGSSAPSTPSPVKRIHQRPPEPESQLDYDNQESEEGDRQPQKRPKLRAKGKGKENARGKISEDPMDAAQRVLENAPRRKRATTTRKSRTISNPIDRPSRGRRVTRGDSGRASRSNKDSRASRTRKKKEDESTPEDLREVRHHLPLFLDVWG
jgi:hypothetical protein